MKKKLIRITTVPISLDKLIEGQLAFMKNNYEVLAVSSGGETLTQVAKKEGVRVVPIEMSRTIIPFKDIKAVWQLYKLFKKEYNGHVLKNVNIFKYLGHVLTDKRNNHAKMTEYLSGNTSPKGNVCPSG